MDKVIWKEYIHNEGNTALKIPEHIAQSWDRCRIHSLNPYQHVGKALLTHHALKAKLRQNRRIIDLVQEEASKISAYYRMNASLFVLTDREGYIIWRQGNAQAKDYANEIGFHEGSCWGELEVGTNAIGMTIQTGRSEAVSTYEHYAILSHDWSCFACPIFDGEELIAVLDVSTFHADKAAHQPLVQLIVERVINRLLKDRLANKQALMTYVVDMNKETILCDEAGRIIYLPGKWQGQPNLAIGKVIDRYAQSYNGVFHSEKILHQGVLIGYTYRFFESNTAKHKYYPGVASRNEGYRAFLERVYRVAESEMPVHIFGESGSGKEIIAQTIHHNSPYQDGPLVSFNCATVNDNLLESELFGYAAGAFTGANPKGYLGKIRQANQGTLFLDEVDSMSLKMQAAILRVLEDKQVTPVGSDTAIPVSFRIVTASNQNIKEAVLAKKFREDLYYRLYVCPLAIPPLRQRTEDILALIEAFCDQHQWHIEWKYPLYQQLKQYPWYGNIRELNHFLERLAILHPYVQPSEREIDDLVQSAALHGTPRSTQPLETSVAKGKAQENHVLATSEKSTLISKEERERQAIIEALEQTHYHMTQAAAQLDMSRSTLYRKLRKYQIHCGSAST